MSVPVRERGESPVEFLDLGRKIRAETLRYCLKLPKRLTFYIGTDTMAHANEVAAATRAANSIYVTNRHEAQLRRDLLIAANNALQKLDGNLGTIYDYLMENPEIFAEGLKDDEEHRDERQKRIKKGRRRIASATQTITALINQEAEKIKGLKDSDRRRYKNLPD